MPFSNGGPFFLKTGSCLLVFECVSLSLCVCVCVAVAVAVFGCTSVSVARFASVLAAQPPSVGRCASPRWEEGASV